MIIILDGFFQMIKTLDVKIMEYLIKMNSVMHFFQAWIIKNVWTYKIKICVE